jgi:uncharacterized protein YecT (DUF1311 family)
MDHDVARVEGASRKWPRDQSTRSWSARLSGAYPGSAVPSVSSCPIDGLSDTDCQPSLMNGPMLPRVGTICISAQIFALVACARVGQKCSAEVAAPPSAALPIPAASDGGSSLECGAIKTIASPSPGLEQHFERAMVMEKSGKHDQALAEARTAAESGLAEAWYWLGMNTVGGYPEAFVKAAELGYPPAFGDALNTLLFRAGDKADVRTAKKIADLARCLRVNVGFEQGELLRTVDRCYEAGEPTASAELTSEERSLYSRPDVDCSRYRASAEATQDDRKYLHCLQAQPTLDTNAVAEVYANGWGVPRDVKLAISLACHGSEVPAELMGVVGALWAVKDFASGEEFRFCDYVTSGLSQGKCAAQEEAAAHAKREETLAALTAHWTPSQKSALASLLKTADAFFSAHSTKEVDMSGTARAAIAIAEEEKLRDLLLSEVRRVEAGNVPADSNLERADRELNRAYAMVLKELTGKGSDDDYGTVGETGVRTTQTRWLAYRDAWVVFGTARWPKTRREQWKAWITTERTVQLREIFGDRSR